jgi:putative membrane protein
MAPQSPNHRAPSVLLAIVLTAVFASGIGAHDYGTWVLEILPVAIGVPVLAATYRRFPLTTVTYVVLTVGALMIALGAHYTYAEVPLGFWVQDWFNLDRNPYDRMGHVLQGAVAAIVLREVLLRRTGMRPDAWLVLLVTLGSLGVSGGFELLEAGAATAGGQGGDYLATQGDPLDSQWDMLMALSGALVCQLALYRLHDQQIRNRDRTPVGYGPGR